ncbi:MULTISPECIES: DNA polymerase IV [Paenibacillus]|uniref:DNA polymerase IV n=1 Tax=Paenibacillus TaxID=44249 RepID=UPI000922C0D1|nr:MULTISPECIES: DNA polymerase IV [Paenibacillus]WDQ35543.1 DNA polymerase IV [Paenibacillus marchantiae]SHN51874.1 DNA polymerase-4 [Paenibacillus sp. ov031]SLJ99301.1 DNA polymerase-4 [Paenibacillus sp. RU5A]SOC66626.1 DNA polymerase-4 [Paenibacillus sp. RU26A]SOC70350.1 DNA polymerase-4 [Paenibacillus sp. RU5M]
MSSDQTHNNINVDRYYPTAGRVILHVDMNAFYCSVHEAEEPELYRGKATAVAGSSEVRKGVIVTCSYTARSRGISTGMVVHQALKKCPDLIVIRPDFHLYRRYSKEFMKIAYSYTPLLEATSIDECYLDITGSRQFGTPLEIAESIQTRIRDELGMPCSIGIAPNKLLAKMASDLKKPNGISILRMRDVPQILWHRPCNEMFGIGKKTAEKLKKLGIETIGQLAKSDERMLTDVFGINGSWLKNSANGINHSAVQAEREANKSIGHTTTLPADISEMDDVHRVLLNISDQVARRLRKHEMLSQGIQITIRTPDMKTITRSRMMEVPTEDASIIYREACALFAKHWRGGKPVRMLGVTLQTLIPREESAIQLDLFEYEQKPKKENLIRIMDQLRDKFGENAVVTAGMLGDDPSVLLRNHKVRGTSLQKDNLQSLD